MNKTPVLLFHLFWDCWLLPCSAMTTQNVKKHWWQPENLPSPWTFARLSRNTVKITTNTLISAIMFNWLNWSLSAYPTLTMLLHEKYVGEPNWKQTSWNYKQYPCKGPLWFLWKTELKITATMDPVCFHYDSQCAVLHRWMERHFYVLVVYNTLTIQTDLQAKETNLTFDYKNSWCLTYNILHMHILHAMVDLLHILWSGVT